LLVYERVYIEVTQIYVKVYMKVPTLL